MDGGHQYVRNVAVRASAPLFPFSAIFSANRSDSLPASKNDGRLFAGRKRDIQSRVDVDSGLALEENMLVLKSLASRTSSSTFTGGAEPSVGIFKPPQLGQQLRRRARFPFCLKAVQDQLIELSTSAVHPLRGLSLSPAVRDWYSSSPAVSWKSPWPSLSQRMSHRYTASRLTSGVPCGPGPTNNAIFVLRPVQPVPAPGLLIHESGLRAA